ncbi:MAG: hypothetical protein J7L16_04145 [Deltaproteobacteria bacterium]|nr:hypothetical protein [Deltaproteobacteria bacterium]
MVQDIMICVATLERGNEGCGELSFPRSAWGCMPNRVLTVPAHVAGNMDIYSRLVSGTPEY